MTHLKKAAQYHENYSLTETESSKRNLLDKGKSASDTPCAHRLLRAAHQEAILLDADPSSVRGYASLFSLVLIGGACMCAWALGVFSLPILLESMPGRAAGAGFDLLLALVWLGLLVGSLVGAIRGFRLDLFAPKQIPIVFNRKSRKVYRFIPEAPELRWSWSCFISTFRSWPMVLVEYDWDSLDAEYWEQVTMFGTVPKTMHVLQFKVREAPGSSVLIGGFVLGSPMTNLKQPALDTWEFIRRFMEEGGPQMATRDDLAPPFPRTWFQSARLMFKGWPLPVLAFGWGLHRFLTQDMETFWGQSLAMKVVQPAAVFLGGIGVLGFTFNWLSFRFLAPDIKLPPELLADAGSELDVAALADTLKS